MIEHLPSDWRERPARRPHPDARGPDARRGRRRPRARRLARRAHRVAVPRMAWNGERRPRGDGSRPARITSASRAQFDGSEGRAALLSPFDLQCIKASGVTFAVSAMERVIEERCRGDASKAEACARSLRDRVGADIRAVKPGSEDAQKLKAALIADGLWSQYLEVAIGPDAEIFTKAPTLSSVGWGDWIGVRSDSAWNNPEPEVVLAVRSRRPHPRRRRSATTSTCATSKAAARCCSARPRTTTPPARSDRSSACSTAASRSTTCARPSCGCEIDGRGRLPARRPELDVADQPRSRPSSSAQTICKHHQYPDGFALFLGTMFAPIVDRGAPGLGFTHKQRRRRARFHGDASACSRTR